MTSILIRGLAAVFRGDEQINDPAVLRSLGGMVYDEERLTDYLGGSQAEDEVAAALVPGGVIRFDYQDGDHLLTAVTEYQSVRPLTDAELRLLVDYTMDQWADGVGENWTCFSADKCGYTVMCLTPGDGVGPAYPSVEYNEE